MEARDWFPIGKVVVSGGEAGVAPFFLLPAMFQSGGPILKRFKLIYAISFSFVLLAILSIWHNDGLGTLRDTLDRQFCSMNANYDTLGSSLYGPQLRKNIAIATSFGNHHDVFLALAWTIERVMKNGTLTVYAPLPFGYGFQDVVDKLGLFHGVAKDNGELIRDVLANPGDGGIDMIILGTCEVECVAFIPPFFLVVLQQFLLLAYLSSESTC